MPDQAGFSPTRRRALQALAAAVLAPAATSACKRAQDAPGVRDIAAIDATLWELPGMGAYAFTPKYLILLVEQDDADVRAKAFPVKHNLTPNSISWDHYAPRLMRGKWAQTPANAWT